MNPEESVTQWFRQLETDDAVAAQKLWERFYGRLVGLARQRLASARAAAADEEDVALSAFFSLVEGARDDRFPDIRDRHDLWKLLVVITARKAGSYARREGRLKRGGGNVRTETDLAKESQSNYLEQLGRGEPPPDLAAALVEELKLRMDELTEQQRQVAILKMNGYENKEIAQQLHCSPRTVTFRLSEIRTKWSSEEE